jgi:hypothetical protein
MTSAVSLANLHPPFVSGNEVAVKSGAQAQPWRLAPRTAEIADTLRHLIPGYSEGDEIVLKLLALALARIELAEKWLAEQDSVVKPGKRGDPWPILKLMGTWEAQAGRLASQLGLTPAARARIGADDAGAGANRALAEHVRSTYGDES